MDEAIANALATLQVERDRVEIEILADAPRGLLGFRGRKARVRATLRPRVGAASADVSREASDTTSEPASTPAPAAAARARALLEEILGHLGVSCAIAVREGDEPGSTVLAVSGEGSGLVIGRHGQTLDALEYMVNRLIGRDGESGGWPGIRRRGELPAPRPRAPRADGKPPRRDAEGDGHARSI